VVYGARLESELGESPREFESRILRQLGFQGCSWSPFLLLSNTVRTPSPVRSQTWMIRWRVQFR
jgi:hypothetical protein